MGLNASKVAGGNGGNRVAQPTLESDVYRGYLVQLIDLGLQPQRPYQGQDKPPAHEIMMTYELCDEFMVDKDGNEVEDKPRWISETMALRSLEADLAKSTKRYLALDPEKVHNGDFVALLGTACNVAVVVNQKGDKSYENVGQVSPISAKKAATMPDLKNTPRFFDLDAPDLETYNSLPKWIQEKLQANLNFKGSKLEALLAGAPQPAKEEEKKAKKETPPKQETEDDEDTPW